MTFADAQSQPNDHRLRGVGGWLLFLCLTLVAFVPIGAGLEIWAFWRRALAGQISELIAATVTGLDIIVVGIGIAAGILLYRTHALGLRLAKLFFAVRLLLGLASMIEGPSLQAANVIAVCSAFLVYLYRSERVRNTYAAAQASRISEVFS
ncbi:MAG TPA: hypothetical protein VEU06_09615 [Micropepsaceae bacterium]|nr:hypothetical protein [Micropepsaceae bacterium]